MKNTKQLNQQEQLIVRVLTGEATEDEKKMLRLLRAQNAEVEALFLDYLKIWEHAKNDTIHKRIDLDVEWTRLKNRLDYQKAQPDSDKAVTKRFTSRMLKYAAVIVLLMLFLAGIFRFFEQTTYEQFAVKDEPQSMLLPDGSSITLNRHASVQYPDDFGKTQERKVILKGDAHFDIKKNKKPFLIEAGDMTIRVLGTSFYVDAAAKNEFDKVIVEEGKVALQAKKGSSKIIVKSGEKASFEKAYRRFSKQHNDERNYLAWMTKKITFRNTPLLQVVKDLNEIYNASVIIKSKDLNNCRYSATFEDQSLDAILKVLESTLEVEINRDGECIEILGEGC